MPVLRPEPEVRQPQRDAGQARGTDVPAATGGVIDIRELTAADVEAIGDRLPLSRLDYHQTYLVAWDGEEPIGHAHVAWAETKLGVPEIQDVFVREERRREGVGAALTAAAEEAALARGHGAVSLSYGIENAPARRLYEKLGYREAGIDPQRVQGTIMVRSGPVEVDDTLIYLVKDLPVDFSHARSS